MQLVSKIISGGQSGVDRAGLDAARYLDIEYGGWVPSSGRAEDYTKAPGLLADYPNLEPAPTDNYRDRTILNIESADATLLIARNRKPHSPGTLLTAKEARKSGKPLLILCPLAPSAIEELRSFLWLMGGDTILNVAGPRESKWPTIYIGAGTLIYKAIKGYNTLPWSSEAPHS
jgi:hypothetical protein